MIGFGTDIVEYRKKELHKLIYHGLLDKNGEFIKIKLAVIDKEQLKKWLNEI